MHGYRGEFPPERFNMARYCLETGAAPDKASLHALAKNGLADYKIPGEYVFMDELPRTPNGKVKRSGLRRAYQP